MISLNKEIVNCKKCKRLVEFREKIASEKKAEGIFHICGPDQMSYLDIGNRIAEYFSLDKNLINHVKTTDLNQKAKRPFKTGFDLDKAKNILNYMPTKFEDSLDIIF